MQIKYTKKLILLLLVIFIPKQIISQNNEGSLDSLTAVQQIKKFNNDYWQAYNNCNVEELLSYETDDLEFYLDDGGVLVGKKQSKIAWEDFCSESEWKTEAELLDEIEIHLMKESDGEIYGAITIGKLRFFRVKTSDGKRIPHTYNDFVTLLIYNDGNWKFSRVLSYNHRNSK